MEFSVLVFHMRSFKSRFVEEIRTRTLKCLVKIEGIGWPKIVCLIFRLCTAARSLIIQIFPGYWRWCNWFEWNIVKCRCRCLFLLNLNFQIFLFLHQTPAIFFEFHIFRSCFLNSMIFISYGGLQLLDFLFRISENWLSFISNETDAYYLFNQTKMWQLIVIELRNTHSVHQIGLCGIWRTKIVIEMTISCHILRERKSSATMFWISL